MSEKKLCPIRFHREPGHIEKMNCIGKKCAFYISEASMCSVRVIALKIAKRL